MGTTYINIIFRKKGCQTKRTTSKMMWTLEPTSSKNQSDNRCDQSAEERRSKNPHPGGCAGAKGELNSNWWRKKQKKAKWRVLKRCSSKVECKKESATKDIFRKANADTEPTTYATALVCLRPRFLLATRLRSCGLSSVAAPGSDSIAYAHSADPGIRGHGLWRYSLKIKLTKYLQNSEP